MQETLTCSSLGFHEGENIGCTEVCTLDISGCSLTCGDGELNGPEECEQGFPGADRNCTDLAGGDVFDVGLQLCSSLCSLREDNCKSFGWDGVDLPGFNGGGNLHNIWVSDDNQIFAVGFASGFVGSFADLLTLDEDGRWSVLSSELISGNATDGSRWGMWGTTSSDLWYGFAGGVAHWDGTSSTVYPFADDASEVVAISGVAGNAIFAVTRASRLFRFDGTTWTQVATISGTPHDLYALDANRVMIAGDSTMQTWDGSSFTQESAPAGTYIAMHGFAPDNIWAIAQGETGLDSILIHYNGTSWLASGEAAGANLRDISGDDTRAFAVGAFTDGKAAATFYFDGVHWINISEPLVNDDRATQELQFAACANDTLLAIGGELPTFLTDAWLWGGFDLALPTRLLPALYQPSDIWIQDPDNWVVVGTDGVNLLANHYDGSRITTRVLGIPRSADLSAAVWGSALDNIYAIGGDGGTLAHFNGNNWVAEDANAEANRFRRIDGSSANNVWAVGDGDTISRFDGSNWVAISPPESGQISNIFSAVYTDSPSFTVVGTIQNGTSESSVFIWDGATWTKADLEITGDVVDIAGSGPDNIWVLSRSRENTESVNQFFHYDHTDTNADARWTEFPHPGGELLFDKLVVLAPDEAFAVGINAVPGSSETLGTSAHFDGEGWADLRFSADGHNAIDAIDGTLVGVGIEGELPQVQPLHWTRRWSCKATEDNCSNRIDDDCDGKIDADDTADCP
tara:strand:+ start:29069 stop:31297 length:2229 start_codon:yes stop_codon:yes gene_type:complete